MMEEGCPSMQAQLGSDHMADGGQPEPTTTTGLQPVNDPQMPDEAANSPSRLVAVSNRESKIKADFEFLWRLRKYLLLLAVLAVSVTYNAGLSPPGGFWTDNNLGHHAGDPLLPVKFFERYEVFFYCNATAFAASLVLIILLLSRGVASQHVWLRSMQVTMILDLFSLMGAYAAGSCRALRSSVYILVLVFAVFLYVWIHILVFIRVVPNGLKEKVQNFVLQIIMKLQTMLNPVLSIFYVSDEQMISQNGHVPEEQSENEQIEEARKFILMLATFAATITYQAGMSPPGGFWAVNKYGYRPGTFVLRKHNLLRFNIFICCNATSFVASLVTVILLLSTELSMHGIRTQALFVCVIVDLLGLIGAYAAGCCRDVATSLSVVFIIVVVLICVLILVMFFQSNTVTTWIVKDVKPRFDKFISKLSWPRKRQEESQPTHQQDAEQANLDSQPTHQQDAEQANLDCQPTHQQDAEQANSDCQPTHQQDAGQANSDSEPTQQQDAEQANSDSQPTHQQDAGQANSDSEPTHQQDAEQANSDSQPGHQHDAEQANSDPEPTHQQDAEQASSDPEPTNQNEIIEEPPKRAYAEQNALPISNQGDNTNNGQGAHHQENSNDYSNRHTDDVRLKKSRTYLLLLAILSVSLTYQAGLNPPGGFWTTNSGNHSAGLNPPGGIWRTNAGNHSAGDPILEDSYHQRYLAFFYFNGTAFAASIVMIIMLLNRKMSNKVIKRRALQTAMITVLLALMGAFFVGSCREKIKSIYISLVMFFVIAYVPLHVWVYWHVIPERWKHWLTKHVWAVFLKKHVHSSGADEKDLERRRNLLLILAVLAATVTYQAGLNPPGGIWPDENSNVGKPGNPVLQDSHRKRYDVFYYSNAVSFVSSVTLVILLLNRESCEHGIKSYAMRVCLVAGLLGLLIAYTAGSCRKVKSIIYLIIIAAAVLFCLVIQVLVLSSTELALKGRKIFRIKPDSDRSLQSPGRANSGSSMAGSVPSNCEKKERKRHKYLMLLAILAASIAYQAGLNPPGGFWSDDSSDGHKAGNPVLKDIHFRRYMVFFVFNSISFMASISVILLLLSKSVRKKNVPLQALHFIMILDLLALMTAYAAGSCRKVRTSIFVFVVVCGVVVYLMIVIILSSGIAKWLKERKGRWLPCCRCPSHFTAADAQIPEQNV